MGVLCSYPQLSQIKQTEISEFQKETLNKFFLKVQQTSKQVVFFPFLKKKALQVNCDFFFLGAGGGVNVDPIHGRQLVMLVFWRYVKNKTRGKEIQTPKVNKTDRVQTSKKRVKNSTPQTHRLKKEMASKWQKHQKWRSTTDRETNRVYLYRQNSSSVECGPEDVCIHQST